MYKEYFGLKESPFSIAPDPRYLYMSEGHREALAHLVYGVRSEGGFVMVTGEVGTGKTTVCRCLLEQMPENTDIAFILNPKLSAEELLATICDEFGIAYPDGNSSVKVFVDRINDYLLDIHSRGRNAVLIIEEAQNLSPGVLEQVRLLTNLETNKRKLLQIIMLGQPELHEMLSHPELRQLAQRITARYHLGPLSRKEVAAYVGHRLAVAGLVKGELFSSSAIRRLFRLSGGIPRLVNILCDRALLGTYVQGKERVDMNTMKRAAQEIYGENKCQGATSKNFRRLLAGFAVILCLYAIAYAYYNYRYQFEAKTTSGAVQPVRAYSPPAHLDTLQTLFERPGSGSEESAYRTLFNQWRIEFEPRGRLTACQQAHAKGLRCLQKKGSLSSLRNINRPAVLKLIDDKGHIFYLTLTALKGQRATFVTGDETRIVDVKEIAQRWSGDYDLLWRVPPHYEGNIKRGSRGPAVEWLERELAIVRGRAEEIRKGPAYDDAMVKHVKEFQIERGLVPDGLVGPETIIKLNTASGSDEPVLDREKS